MYGLRFRFRFQGTGFRVQGFGFRVTWSVARVSEPERGINPKLLRVESRLWPQDVTVGVFSKCDLSHFVAE